MTSNPETPESKPKSSFMGMFDKVKEAVSNAMPSDATMEEFKQKVKTHAESVSATVSENIKKVDIDKISNKIKDTVNSVKDKATSATNNNTPENTTTTEDKDKKDHQP